MALVEVPDWVANLMPWEDAGEVIGATLTLYAATAIHEADNRLRMRQREDQRSARHRFEDLIGDSPPWRVACDEARRFALTEWPVLITGATGTGKELMAQALHNAGPRAGRPFVAVNCAALPEGLMESELFGHEDGAFTGARRGGRRGLFERAHTGTLFLDEIGDLPLHLQSRLLRVLQEGEIQRLGAAAPIPVDVRVLAATHQPFHNWVQQGRFRADLYYRLEVLRLALPPLRDRAGDLDRLATALLGQSLRRQGLAWPAAATRTPPTPWA
jgi:transcriptional regulator, propionate catabolism operon regulatory protein